MFEQITMAAADPILGLNDAFKADPRNDKINLGVGVYKDDLGETPILASVKQAEAKLLNDEHSKSYLGIEGHQLYRQAVLTLLFGSEHSVLTSERAAIVQAPGGTGALRIAAEFIKSCVGNKKVWISNPSWANHRQIFETVGLEVAEYRYYDPSSKGLDFAGMMSDIDDLSSDDIVILHGCCHNPTGIDPTPEQWQQLATSAKTKGWLPLFDFAYQGFAEDVEADAYGLRLFASELNELLVANSFSKNFGLYNERIGAMTVVARTAEQATTVLSQVKRVIRANYSNPPSHGAQVVATILTNPELKALWLAEVAEMRVRIKAMRTGLVEGLTAAGVDGDFSFIDAQNGMFSFSGLSPQQVERLKAEFGIYIVGSGRIAVSGITSSNLPTLINAIKAVW